MDNKHVYIAPDEMMQSPKLLLEGLHKLYFERLQYYAFTMIHHSEAARDIVQDAFIGFWDRRKELMNRHEHTRNFLYMSVKNSCLKFIRHNKVVDKYIDRQDVHAMEEEMADSKMIRAEVLFEIYTVIESLPPAMRRISKLAYLEGLKNNEIARQLEISVETVKVQKKRALKQLRLKLNPESLLSLAILIKLNLEEYSDYLCVI